MGEHRDEDAAEPAQREGAVVAFARSLTVAGLARTLFSSGCILATLAATRIATEAGAAPPSDWVQLGCAAAWIALGAWTLAGAARRRRDWKARGRAPIVLMGWALVVGPLSISGHHGRDLIDLFETVLSGPTLGLYVVLDGLLLKESTVTVEDVEREREEGRV